MWVMVPPRLTRTTLETRGSEQKCSVKFEENAAASTGQASRCWQTQTPDITFLLGPPAPIKHLRASRNRSVQGKYPETKAGKQLSLSAITEIDGCTFLSSLIFDQILEIERHLAYSRLRLAPILREPVHQRGIPHETKNNPRFC
ncbi:hypothetical protein TWF718_001039 [Orbilia javanica]|uniref:Uncharacterized protein n=1 Tax=Orbilia javanica TaxID=47235 RepID=A0AAN8RMG0_9PEZI